MDFFLNTVLPAATTDTVEIERDRRLRAGFAFKNKMVQGDLTSQNFIAIRGGNAFVAVQAGSLTGDYRWENASADFTWRMADNTNVPLDAPEMVTMAQMAGTFLTQMMANAAALKTRIRAGEKIQNIQDNALWPLAL